MKFVKIRYEGASAYIDRTPLKNAWEPGDVKLVSERDAKTLLAYLEFQRVVDGEAAPKKADKKAESQAADQPDDAAELELAQQALAESQAVEEKAKRLTENTLLEIEQMDKDALEAYARQNYGVDIDRRRSLDNLRNQVTELVQG